jgi:hypothetical protein
LFPHELRALLIHVVIRIDHKVNAASRRNTSVGRSGPDTRKSTSPYTYAAVIIMPSLTPAQDVLKMLTPMKHLQKIELVDNDHQATHHLTPPLKELAEAAQMVLRGGSQDAGYPDRHVSVRFAQDVVRSFPI